jgi:hypothetical protein
MKTLDSFEIPFPYREINPLPLNVQPVFYSKATGGCLFEVN